MTTPTRAEALQAAGAVATELAPESAVQQADEAKAIRFEATSEAQTRAAIDAAVRDMIKRRLEIDPKTREVVFQVVDEATGDVVRQIPEEMLLKLRAYAREMRAADAGDEGERVRRTA
jgi:uncharacterized FlaG/YvyC family protein